MQTRFPPAAILLAAGLGTRLRPLTETRPLPLIERVVAPLAAEGVSRFAVNAHYRAEQMTAAVSALPVRFPGCRFALSHEDEMPLGTGGGARKALDLVEGDPVLVSNTDSFWRREDDAPLERMARRLDQTPDAIVLLCAHPARAHGFGRSHDFCLDPRGTITLDAGLPVIYAGLALLGRRWLADGPEDPFSMLQLFERAEEEGRLRGVLLNAPWFHVGDPEGLAEAEHALREG